MNSLTESNSKIIVSFVSDVIVDEFELSINLFAWAWPDTDATSSLVYESYPW